MSLAPIVYALTVAAAFAAPAGPPAPTPAPGATPSPEPGPSGDAAAGSVAPEDPADVTKYQFTGLDIDGELRTPALLQFLARIGGEFETVGIPHRSFMPELQATVAEDAL